MRRIPLLCLIVGLLPTSGAGQATPPPRGGLVEASGFSHRVSNDFGHWSGGRLRAVLPAGRGNVFYLEGTAQRAFGDEGAYAAVAHQHSFGDSWISYVGVGGGTGKFYFPELRLDATLTRKLLASHRLLATIGGTWVRSKDVYRDRAVQASLTGYLSAVVVVEAGGRVNWSTPGDVASQRAFLALTLGRAGSHYVVLRGAGGSEGYQLTGSGATAQKFNSAEASIAWRQWLGARLGFVLGGEWYDSPFYTRTGVQLGLFASW
ncbi:MAG: YaiO family outer membrane beta-barrel protein [Gemmatimonadota bacterium]|mgnify:CR=1 FL=1|nr:YaiO family outer membrane beta-barrel protein [Gemmatimonadota bacterium]